MAILNIQHPTALLDRHVRGIERLDGIDYPFDGIVECVTVPAPSSKRHGVEFFVGEQFVSVSDCVVLDFVPRA